MRSSRNSDRAPAAPPLPIKPLPGAIGLITTWSPGRMPSTPLADLDHLARRLVSKRGRALARGEAATGDGEVAGDERPLLTAPAGCGDPASEVGRRQQRPPFIEWSVCSASGTTTAALLRSGSP
jgi:hypothetical protein